jgi:hypothetical protein
MKSTNEKSVGQGRFKKLCLIFILSMMVSVEVVHFTRMPRSLFPVVTQDPRESWIWFIQTFVGLCQFLL